MTPSDAWTITFDDGKESALHAADILESVGWLAYFFVVGSWIGRKGYLSREHLVDLHRRGHVVGSHSMSHPDPISGLPYTRIVGEWSDSLEMLRDILGSNVETAAVPGGGLSKPVVSAGVEAGIRALFTSEPTSRIRFMSDCAVIGRYAIRNSTPASDVVALAGGDRITCGGQWLGWNGRKAAKKALGASYYSIRARLLASKETAES